MLLLRRSLLGSLAGAALLGALSCDNSITSLEVLPALDAASTDSTAGSWQMIVLSGPTQFTVPAPAAETSSTYLAELAAIKTVQANLGAAQRKVIDYWSGGGVLRWNEIARGLVARFNLPPAPRADGTYPVPDPENPFADPQFPFANPPYAARAYSYLSVAQYEALKTAWYWKYQYHRRAPAQVDAGVHALVPLSSLPAYPSEDAVISGVTVEMLKVLFPAAVEEITRRAGDQRNAALWSGKATASDIAAGLALGKQVAAVFVARAGSDGMRTAGGTPALWKAMADTAIGHGEVPWISQETPPRPPMLPNFRLVLMWLMTPPDLANEQPPAPPSTSSDQMRDEVAEVRHAVDHLTNAELAIAQKWNDGGGTYTPPGHWNDIATEYVRDARMSEVRSARAFALLNMAMHDAAVACWGVKYQYFNPRPVQLDPNIQTLIGLPNFPAYPSGHSTFSSAAAEVLSYLFPAAANDFEAMKNEASISRLYGGIHYRSDIERGKEHGFRIGGYAVRFGQNDGAN